jgi:hypothetical protein
MKHTLQRLREWWAQRREERIIRRYVSVGMDWGDAASYSYLGTPVGWPAYCDGLEYWEARYAALGYRPVPREEWVPIGGYGVPVEPWLRIPARAEAA